MIDLEAEYDNLAKVPEHQAIIAGWTRDAAAFRAAHATAELDLPYGPTPRQALDLFWPGQGRDAPLALFIHGGYWQRLDRGFFSHFARGLLAHGVAVAVPSYDLCPQVTLAELTQQIRDMATFLRRRHPGRLLATGHSAGGHLAAMLLADGFVAAALPISGLFDLVPLLSTSLNAALRLDAAEARRLSPMLLPAPAGRLHAVVGGEEGAEFTRQSRGIAEAWHGTCNSLPGRNHFTVIDDLLDPGSAMVHTALGLLEAAP